MKAYRVPEIKCIACGHTHDGATSLFKGRRPRPGDAMMCIMCGVFMIYTDDLQYRAPTPEELARLTGDSRVQRLIAAHTLTHGLKRDDAPITTKPAHCPACAKLLYNPNNGLPRQPRPNDLVVCDDCSTVLTFTADMQLRLLRADESAALMQRDDVQEVMRAVHRLAEKRRKQ